MLEIEDETDLERMKRELRSKLEEVRQLRTDIEMEERRIENEK